MTHKQLKKSPPNFMYPVACPICGLTFKAKNNLMPDLESHGVIKLAQALAKFLIQNSENKRK